MKSEEGYGLIPRLIVAIWHFKVSFTVQFIGEVSKYLIKYVSQKITHFKYKKDS